MGLRIVQICSATCGYYIVVGIDETCFLFFHWPQISHACGLGDLADADLVEFFLGGGFAILSLRLFTALTSVAILPSSHTTSV